MATAPKVLHISTHYSGGAGIAARRLDLALKKQGIDSRLLVMYGGDQNLAVDHTTEAQAKREVARSKRWYKCLRRERYNNRPKKIKGEYEIFSTPLTSQRVEQSPLVAEANIIHLHWIANFINFPTFFSSLQNKKIVWTMHDMNPFLGGFHYLGDRERNPRVRSHELLLSDIKREAYAHLTAEDLHLVYPSEWLKKHAQESGAFGSAEHHVIRNCIDTSVFAPVNREKCRAAIGVDSDVPLLLFGSEVVGNRRKGFDILLDALRRLRGQSVEVELLIFGREVAFDDIDGFKTHHLGKLTDAASLVAAYSAADFLILPSREDNLPNVMLESLSCGTPVVSFANGGMREHLLDGKNGVIVNETTAESLAEGIKMTVRKSFDRRFIRKYAETHFAESVISKKFIDEVYQF